MRKRCDIWGGVCAKNIGNYEYIFCKTAWTTVTTCCWTIAIGLTVWHWDKICSPNLGIKPSLSRLERMQRYAGPEPRQILLHLPQPCPVSFCYCEDSDYFGDSVLLRRKNLEQKPTSRIFLPNSVSEIFISRIIWRKRWFYPNLHIVMVQFILFINSSWCKIASVRQGIESILAPQPAATTFVFSSVLSFFYGCM